MWREVLRRLIHTPLGILTALMLWRMPVGGVVFAFGFLVYEIAEDWRKGDQAYVDVFGYLLGLGVGIVAIMIWG